MKQVTIIATILVVSVLIMLVATIFSYGQAVVVIAQQAAAPPGIPSADNSTDGQAGTTLGMPSNSSKGEANSSCTTLIQCPP